MWSFGSFRVAYLIARLSPTDIRKCVVMLSEVASYKLVFETSIEFSRIYLYEAVPFMVIKASPSRRLGVA